MLIEDGKVMFGAWLPDLPYLNNPGLVEAQNAIPVDDSYKDFLEITTSDDALAAAPMGAYAAIDDVGDPEIYAGTQTNIYEKVGTSWTDRTPAPYAVPSNGYWRFAQFDTTIIATNFNDVPQKKTIGSSSNFEVLAGTGTAPNARQVGVINRFVFLGDTDDGLNGVVPWRVQWSAINDVSNWPTPGTSDARTVQSGEQFLDSSSGAVTAIANGQFYGLVFQERAISRFTYIGGDIVFQIDTYERSRGCWAAQSMIQVGNVCYFLAVDGWYVTDGQAVKALGDGKWDKWFYADFDQSYIERLRAGIDWQNKCIYWCFPTPSATSGVPDRILIYNFVRDRAAWAQETVQLIFASYTQGYTLDQLDSLFTSIDDMTITLDSTLWQGGIPTIMGFLSNTLGTFSGAALAARFETGETDQNPFGRVFIRGVRPLVTGDPTAVTVSLAARDAQDNAARTFGSPVTRTMRTGVCDFRTHGRFISARIDVTGGFDRAIGVGIDAERGDLV